MWDPLLMFCPGFVFRWVLLRQSGLPAWSVGDMTRSTHLHRAGFFSGYIVFLFCFICFTGLLSCSSFSLDGRFWLCYHRPSLFFFNRLCDHTPTTDVSPPESNVSRWDITFTDFFLRLLAAKFKSAQFFGTILRDYEWGGEGRLVRCYLLCILRPSRVSCWSKSLRMHQRRSRARNTHSKL